MLESILSGWNEDLGEELAALYQDLHRHPELSSHEHRTAERLAEAIAALGFDVTAGVGGTGVVGVLGNGDGPVVMLRADIDALPVEEQTGLPYASTARGVDQDGRETPVMHACGHDMHAACLVGAATLLSLARHDWSGTLLVVFQPAEELAHGARDMIRDGLFERFPAPDVVFGQHVAPLPAGMIGYGDGPIMAGSDSARVTLFGRGGHAARPQTTIDPVLIAASVVLRLQGIVAREVAPGEAAVVTVGRLRAGTKDNIIPDEADLGINVRTYSPRVRTAVRAAIERIIRAEADAAGVERAPEVEWHTSTPLLQSDPDATRLIVAAFGRHFGEERLLRMPQVTASEDIGHFGTAAGVPTVYWFWGGLERERVLAAVADGSLDQLPSNHSSHFAPLIEPTLATGTQALAVAAAAWLAEHGRQTPATRADV